MNQNIEIQWFDEYAPRRVGIVKKKSKGGRMIYRLRYRLPTGDECNPKAGNSMEEARRLARTTHQRLLAQMWIPEECDKIIKTLALDQPDSTHSDRLTIAEAFTMFKKSMLRGAATNTVKNQGLLLDRMVTLITETCPHRKFIDELTAEDIENVLERKASETFKYRGKRKHPSDVVIDDHLRMFRRLFLFLVKRKKVTDNPALLIKYLNEGGQSVRDVIPDDATMKRVYRELEKLGNKNRSSWSPLQDIVHFLVESGARRTEVLAMEWTDIQSDQWIISEKTCSDGFHFKPKSKKSHRVYQLTEEMQAIIDRQPRVSSFVFPKVRIRILDGCPSKQRFPSGVAKCCKCPLKRDRNTCEFRSVEYSRLSEITHAWTRVRQKADATHITVHDLRRYHNDKLREFGLSHEESGALIGNSSRVNELHYDPHNNRRLQRLASEKRHRIGRIAPIIESDV